MGLKWRNNLTKNPKPKRKPEDKAKAKARHDRFTAANPVLKIYAPKEHHQAIKDFAKSLK